jgi:predicted enzyme involved in methoxymalonyl-ACP biosynthesis
MKTKATKPDDKDNELERLRAELRMQQRTLAALTEKLKAQEESTSDAWEILAVLWRDRAKAAKLKDKASPDEAVTEDENENFFRGLQLMLRAERHEERIKAGLESLRSHSTRRAS